MTVYLEEACLGTPMRTVAADGTRIAFRVIGQGPALLLIIGYRLGGDAWPAAFVDTLARDFRVILLDNRGTGESDKPAFGYSMGNLAQDALRVLDFLGIRQAHVLGYSMGGAIAQELGCAAPQRVAKLVLCNTWSGVFSSSLGGPTSLEVWGGPLFAPWRAAYQFWSTMHGIREGGAGDDGESERRAPESVAMLQRQAMLHFEVRPRLVAITSPTLVLAGTDDRVVPPGNGGIIADRIPNARLQLMPKLGHRAVWESPEGMAGIVAAFLRDGASRPSR